MKKTLNDISDTQRLTVSFKDNGHIVLQKEWRKSQTDRWIPSKGIELTHQDCDRLRELLGNNN